MAMFQTEKNYYLTVIQQHPKRKSKKSTAAKRVFGKLLAYTGKARYNMVKISKIFA